jgi:hypothetical protein
MPRLVMLILGVVLSAGIAVGASYFAVVSQNPGQLPPPGGAGSVVYGSPSP